MVGSGVRFIVPVRRSWLFIVLFFVISSVPAKAQDKFTLSWYHTYTDTSFKAVQRHQFKLLDKSYKTASLFNRGTYWFKLTLTDAQPAKTRTIKIANPHLDTVCLYYKQDGRFVLMAVDGNNFRKNHSDHLRYTQFKVPGNRREFYFKTNFKKDVVFPLKIEPSISFNKSEQLSFFRLGLYYGFVLMVIGVNIFFYFIFRDLKYIYYCIFLFFIAFTFAYSDGLFVLITHNAWWLNNADIPVHLLVAPAGAIFATSFLEIDRSYPKMKWIAVLLVMTMLTAYLTHLLFGGLYPLLIGEMAGLSVLSFYWFTGVYRFKQDVFARFFVIAYGLVLVFAFDFFLVRKLGWNFLNMTHNQLKIASTIEMVVLSWAITYRVKLLHKENKNFQAEISWYMQQAIAGDRATDAGHKADEKDVYEEVRQKFNLSERELDVLKGITQGYTNIEIAEQLFVSSNTVKFHIRNIYEKLEISSRAQAVSKVHQL